MQPVFASLLQEIPQGSNTGPQRVFALSTSKVLAKVNSLRPNLRLVIALHSPEALIETGQRICPLEKRRDGHRFADEQSVL